MMQNGDTYQLVLDFDFSIIFCVEDITFKFKKIRKKILIITFIS